MMARNNSSFTYLPPLLFSATLFTSAGLLFWIQPLIGKTLLPLWGGVPAVWNTCLLFFQGMLLVGYLYALASIRWLNLPVQIAIHLILLVVIAIYLWLFPVQATISSSLTSASPTVSILATLLFTVGLPFFIISASNPLLQSWFSRSKHYLAVDPYFLFAASNAGSLIALVAFPLVLEPSLGLSEQHRLWRVGFAVLVTLICVIAFIGLKASTTASLDQEHESDPSVTVLRRLRWLALSFVPSSLMLGVTTYITTDVAAVPLLWVIPLALYLLSFVLAFTRKQFASVALLRRVMLVAALIVTLILASGATEPAWALIFANLGFLFVAGLACHKQLANDRPSTTHLSEYYLWIALGGALGSFFNVFVAAALFNSVLEYPVAIVLACMLQTGEPAGSDKQVGFRKNYPDLLYPLGLYVLTVGLAVLVTYSRVNSPTFKLIIVLVVPLMIINHFFRARPVRFALGLCAVMLGSIHLTGDMGPTVHVDRNFFGTIRVTTESMGINTLYSGNTIHGRQFVDQSRRCEPLSYHHEHGPLGQVMAVFNAAPANHRVAVIGLGVGAMAAYSKPAQEWTFYEINPDVITLASNSQHFTYLQNCASGSVSVVEGDARLKLQNASEGQYGLIVLDAFSSDAIPVHLLTQQSLDLYLSKLAAGGILAFHISSRTLDLKPILADLAQSRKLICIGFDDLKPSSIEGKDPSQWVVMARAEAEISNLSINTQWKRLEGTGARVWSDDFSNIVRAIRWD
jgi:hypothetical protein